MEQYITHNPFVWRAPASKTQSQGPLAGLTVAVKDLFHIEGVPTTAGNPDWLASHATPTQTASAVTKLLEAGATLVGKTITDELAYSLNGQNIHYGTPENPVTPERLPGGSSSGSAVAVSGNLADIGLGTDTGGSIRVPSSYNGLFGLRPTYGVIAMDNMVPLAPDFDTIGWMTKDIATLENVADVLLNEQTVSDSQPNLAYADNLIQSVEHTDQSLAWLKEKGIDQAISLDPNEYGTGNAFRILQGAAIYQQHGAWLTEQQPAIAPDIKARFDALPALTEQEILDAKTSQQQIIAQIDILFSQYDALIIPTTPGKSPLLSTQDSELADYRNQLLGMTAFAGLAGLPQLHLPLFTLDGAPCGLSLIGARGSDRQLIAWAKQLVDAHS